MTAHLDVCFNEISEKRLPCDGRPKGNHDRDAVMAEFCKVTNRQPGKWGRRDSQS